METIDQQDYDKNFADIPIAKLLDGNHHFVIPSFQRGYRWEEKQVVDLLEDIKQFADPNNNSSESYYLQPIVVKKIKYRGVDSWEVLDGQQRLTTLLLILKELLRGYMTPKDSAKYQPLLYDITYTNRPALNFDNPCASDNIDSYYLREAFDTITQWCEQNEDFTDIIRTLFYSKFTKQVKIIWYAIDEDSKDLKSISIFNRLNKGKISLTSSELIKALFIMYYDQQDSALSAEQLSMEWNEMERRFQDNKFWYFISDDMSGTQTRIDVLFDFLTLKSSDKDTDYSYREFQKLYDYCCEQKRNKSNMTFCHPWAKEIHNMQDAWRKVRKTFDTLVAWYEDNMYYHYVGYLVALGSTPLDIFNYLETAKAISKEEEPGKEWTVDDTMLALRRKMMDRFKENNVYIPKEKIDDWGYNNADFVSRVLLLFNVESCRIGNNIRFDFDRYKNENWDIEHIESRNNASLQEFDDRVRWLKQVKLVLGFEDTERAKQLQGECEDIIRMFENKETKYETRYKEFFVVINKHYAREASDEDDDAVDLSTKDKDNISNLTLLDSATNREYKDAPFAYKRYCIVEYDKKGNRFIPLCTRNVFLKYYSDSNKKTSYFDTLRWNEDDRTGYMKAIHEAVDPIFDSVIKEEMEVNNV
jgi:hypothetical protein